MIDGNKRDFLEKLKKYKLQGLAFLTAASCVVGGTFYAMNSRKVDVLKLHNNLKHEVLIPELADISVVEAEEQAKINKIRGDKRDKTDEIEDTCENDGERNGDEISEPEMMDAPKIIDTFVSDILDDNEEAALIPQSAPEELSNCVFKDPVISYVDNGDGTHLKVSRYRCDVCGKELVQEERQDCVYTIDSIDSKCEYKSCVCGGMLEEKHKYGDGIEKDKHILYPCVNDGCGYTLIIQKFEDNKREHIHNRDYKVNYEGITPKEHVVVTTGTCNLADCNEPVIVAKQKVEHMYDDGVLSEDGMTLTKTCACGYKQVSKAPHQHVYSEPVITYENITDKSHTCVSTQNCTGRGCDEPIIVMKEILEHEFDEGVISDDLKTITYTCACSYKLECEYVHEHNYGESVVTYEDISDDRHVRVNTSICDERGCAEPVLVEKVPEQHDLVGTPNKAEGKMVYDCECGYSREEHLHSDVPENLNYVFAGANDDGTHSYVADYNCDFCGEKLVDEKTEDCTYTTTRESIGITNPNNIHKVVDICDVCGHKEVIGTEPCTKVGDVKCIKMGPYIYEYYNCAASPGCYVDRTPHVNHAIIEWDISESKHTGYCICSEYRIEGEHYYLLDGNTARCRVCSKTKEVAPHTHLPNEMDIWDLIFTDERKQGLVSDSTEYNPNPSPDDYCNAYIVTCHTCGGKYLIEYPHKWQDGKCTRSGCGVLESTTVLEDGDELVLDSNGRDSVYVYDTNQDVVNIPYEETENEEVSVSSPQISTVSSPSIMTQVKRLGRSFR